MAADDHEILMDADYEEYVEGSDEEGLDSPSKKQKLDAERTRAELQMATDPQDDATMDDNEEIPCSVEEE